MCRCFPSHHYKKWNKPACSKIAHHYTSAAAAVRKHSGFSPNTNTHVHTPSTRPFLSRLSSFRLFFFTIFLDILLGAMRLHFPEGFTGKLDMASLFPCSALSQSAGGNCFSRMVLPQGLIQLRFSQIISCLCCFRFASSPEFFVCVCVFYTSF